MSSLALPALQCLGCGKGLWCGREQKPSGVPYTAQKPPPGSKAPLSVWILKMLQALSPFSSVPSRKETDAFISDQRSWKTMPHGAKQSRYYFYLHYNTFIINILFVLWIHVLRSFTFVMLILPLRKQDISTRAQGKLCISQDYFNISLIRAFLCLLNIILNILFFCWCCEWGFSLCAHN